MKFAWYIAKRYLISKKSFNIINIISGISVAGITIGTMALIVVLSVFNGFEGLIVSLFDTYSPDLQVTAIKGKTFVPEEINVRQIEQLEGVAQVVEVVEDNALLKHQASQYIISLKGVGDNYQQATSLDSMLIDGQFILREGNMNFAVLGAGVAYHLGVFLRAKVDPITVYVPSRTRKPGVSLDNAFNSRNIIPSGVLSLHQEFDLKYVIVPIGFARELFEYESQVTAMEISLHPDADADDMQEKISILAGEGFLVKNRYQQQELLYKIMKTEKWAIFFILTFILIIAAFNVIGSITMLILDKKKDIAVLHSMGANNQLIKRIFRVEGMMVSVVGGIIGLILGAVLCFLQQEFSLITLGGGEGSFIIEAYPVEMKFIDFIYVFLTVLIIGYLAAYYPVSRISRKYLHQRLQ